MGYLEGAVRHILVADEAQAIRSDGDGGILADLASTVQGAERRGATGSVGAMGHLEGAICHVVVADETQAIGPNGHGCIKPNFPYAVERGERESWTRRTGIVRCDTRDHSDASEKSDS
jgi:hypothetical protein